MRFFLLDHFSRHPWGCVEALKPFLGPFFPRKLLINMLVTLIGENSASESVIHVQGESLLIMIMNCLLSVLWFSIRNGPEHSRTPLANF